MFEINGEGVFGGEGDLSCQQLVHDDTERVLVGVGGGGLGFGLFRRDVVGRSGGEVCGGDAGRLHGAEQAKVRLLRPGR